MQIVASWRKQHYCRFQRVFGNAFLWLWKIFTWNCTVGSNVECFLIKMTSMQKSGQSLSTLREIHLRHSALCSQVLLTTVTPEVSQELHFPARADAIYEMQMCCSTPVQKFKLLVAEPGSLTSKHSGKMEQHAESLGVGKKRWNLLLREHS